MAIHREDIKAYLAECGGRVSLADLVVDVLPILGIGHNLLGRLLYSGVAKGILELQGLSPEVVLLKSTPGAQ